MKEQFEDIRLREVEAIWEIGETRKEAFRLMATEAAAACDRPIAMITIVDRTYQWIKAQVGMPKLRIARSSGICELTMMKTDFLEIADLSRDFTFQSNPMVTGAPGLRSYAGVPLVSARGFPLGALCTLDTKPGALSPEQRQKLSEISQRIMASLDLNREASHRERLMPNRSSASEIIKLAAHKSFATPELRPKFYIGRIVGDQLFCDEYGMASELAKIFQRFAAEGAKSLSIETESDKGLVSFAVSSEGSSPRKLYVRGLPLASPGALVEAA